MENTINYAGIGRRVRKARRNLQLTQFELAERAGLTPTNISHIERGANKVSLPALVCIANALQVSVDDLLRDSLEAPRLSDRVQEPQLLWEARDCTEAERELLTDVFVAMKRAVRRAAR